MFSKKKLLKNKIINFFKEKCFLEIKKIFTTITIRVEVEFSCRHHRYDQILPNDFY